MVKLLIAVVITVGLAAALLALMGPGINSVPSGLQTGKVFASHDPAP
jgi:hypothetical protein